MLVRAECEVFEERGQEAAALYVEVSEGDGVTVSDLRLGKYLSWNKGNTTQLFVEMPNVALLNKSCTDTEMFFP